MKRTFLLAGWLLSMPWISGAALAQGVPGPDAQKARLVARLYQATYGAQLRCSGSAQWAGHAQTLARFRSTYPELMREVDGSPYLAQAKASFQDFLSANPTSATSDKNLLQECGALESILRSLIDAPGAKEGVAEYVRLLKE